MEYSHRKILYSLEDYELYGMNIVFPEVEECKENIDRIFYEEAKYVIQKVEEIHPYFLSVFYNKRNYYSAKKHFLNSIPLKCDLHFFQYLMGKFFKILHDGHMNIRFLNDESLEYKMLIINNEVVYNGERVLEVGGVVIFDIIKEIGNIVYFNNDSERKIHFEYYLNSKNFLALINCCIDNAEVLVKTIANSYTIAFKKSEMSQCMNLSEMINNKILYIKYQTCYESVNTNCFVNSIRKNILNHKPTQIIIDLRNNTGGSGLTNEKLLNVLGLKYLGGKTIVRIDKEQFESEYKKAVTVHQNIIFFSARTREEDAINPNYSIVILCNSYTYSSAFQLAYDLHIRKLATVIGEIPAGSPNSFGDLLFYKTPQMKIPFYISYKYFLNPTDEKELVPDITIDGKSALTRGLKYFSC